MQATPPLSHGAPAAPAGLSPTLLTLLGPHPASFPTLQFIPCWTGLTTYTHFRNQPVIDGELGCSRPPPPPLPLLPSLPSTSPWRPSVFAPAGGYANGFKQLCPGGNVKNCIKVATWYVDGPFANTSCDPERCSSCAPTAERAEPIREKPFKQDIK